MHESNLILTFGGQTLIALGDLIDEEIKLVRTPAAPAVTPIVRASAAKIFGGLNLTHSLNWTVRREFKTIEEARAYEWSRMATLPEGAQTLVVTVSGITATLIDAHLTSFSLVHVLGQAGIITETVAAIGGALSHAGTVEISDPIATPAAPADIPATEAATPASPADIPATEAATPASPDEIPYVDDREAILADDTWNDAGKWIDDQPFTDA